MKPAQAVVLHLSDVIPWQQHRGRTPKDVNAHLSVTNIGPDPEMALLALQGLTELSREDTLRFERARPGRAPETVTLPGVYYDGENPYIAQLKRTGCEFTVTAYAWVCPKEMGTAPHTCSGTCSIVKVAEVIS